MTNQDHPHQPTLTPEETKNQQLLEIYAKAGQCYFRLQQISEEQTKLRQHLTSLQSLLTKLLQPEQSND